MQKILNHFDNKTILITGATGSLGTQLLCFLLANTKIKKVIAYSRGEFGQYNLKRKVEEKFSEHKGKVRYFIGDVRDLDRLKYAVKDINYIIHLAALKHIDVCEYNPFEAVKTNILGTENIISAAQAAKVDKLVTISTDKAVSPINLYGATKLSAEKLTIAANNHKGSEQTKFSVVRYGNVVGSSGSAINLFLELASKKGSKKNQDFPITDKKMTRFFITFHQSMMQILKAIYQLEGGEVFIPKIPSVKIIDLISLYAGDNKIKEIGIRSGEKLHEVLISKDDTSEIYQFDDHFVMLPSKNLFTGRNLYQQYKNQGKAVEPFFEYSSNGGKFLSEDKLKQEIMNGLAQIV